ncbi:splicing factor 3A subunit 1 [Drosophila albomicans]|uniref:Splicing factor 3A subunit 1 n=1 Tax=Drosophila albomicans TaxID=7291 RepID=A0A6P8XQN9_DROAB|nr:splicing factor 3A subunit 1 [Drosophila albomicans]XP_034113620.1 splicing factor 3A subunit 1 [Drosophila albomicans]XP_051862509.1 splicing factor 3A subunit 1 [Drosophila albomicans]
MPSLDADVSNEQFNNEQSKPMSGPIVGIIYPPPEVRNIVDKTASFVARNGPEFEARIRQNELGNPKFNFLNGGDPYHAYYRHKVNEFREGNDAGLTAVAGLKQLAVSSAAQQRQQEILKQVVEQQFVPKEPPAEFEFIADPPSIAAMDLDIVKLTAQFVARNGRQFLTNLMSREQRNFQFDFLRPQHSLFQYFTKLLEQYTKVLIPPKDLLTKLRFESSPGRASQVKVLEQVKYRANWQRHQEAQRRREEEKIERERVAYAQIDWHDFVVVETVDYQPFESGNFPPPTNPDEVGARVLMEERLLEEEGDIEMQIESDDEDDSPLASHLDSGVKLSQMENRVGIQMKNATAYGQPANAKRDNTQVQDMDEASSDEDTPTTKMQPSVAPMLPPTHDKVVVKKYDPKATQPKPAPVATDEYLISPITGEKIPASKVSEHMRIGLLDPRWVEQRDKHTVEKINQDNVFAAGTAIEASLKQLAERRTDIFGVGDEETVIGKKLGEEETKKDDRVTWDGHTSSVEAATRAARANITLEDQIHQIHKVKGLLHDEEKEKIGPKPVGNKATLSAPPQPSSSKNQHSNHPHSQPQHHQGGGGGGGHHHPPPHHHHQSHPPPSSMHQHQQHQQQPPPHNMPPAGNPVMMMQRPPMMPTPYGGGPGGYMNMPSGGGPPQISPAPPVEIMPMEDEPPTKKIRSEDNLIPEAEFISLHKSPVTIQVQVPNTDKSEWKLNGQMIAVTLALTDPIANLKAKLQDETGMPPAKQKIFYEGMFFKDNNTMAFYNLLSGTTVHLQVKERGGRKK